MITERSNLAKFLKVVNMQMKKKYDIFCVIDGTEGVGKSRGLLLNMIDYWYTVILGKPVPKWSINIDVKDWVNHLDKCEPREMVGLDEAGDSMDSMQFANKFNKILYQAYTIIREKLSFSIVVLPSFFDLSPRFRKRRVRFLIHCYKRVDNRCDDCSKLFVGNVCPSCGSKNFRKGFVMYEIYDRPKINKILELNMFKHIKKVRCGITPLLRGITYEYTGEFADYYSGLKKQKMEEVLFKLKESVDDFSGVKKCNHEWRYTKTDAMWWCRKCGVETKQSPYRGE